MTAQDPLAGPGALVRRSGSYDGFLAAMRDASRGTSALATLNIDVAADFSNALMSGWARVCDVLAFYQERIANEGYLPTAVEPASIVLLAAGIGEQRRLAVGAQANLALQLVSAAGQPASLFVEPGPALTVQNVPSVAGDLPVIFECAERRELRLVWNALPSVVPLVTRPACIRSGCRSVRVTGTSLGIRPGGALLLTAAGDQTWLVIADTVEVDRVRGFTVVTWREPVPRPVEGSPVAISSATRFAGRAGIFGRTAIAWNDLSDDKKQALGTRAGGVMALDRRRVTPYPRKAGPELWTRPPRSAPPPDGIQALLGIGGNGLLAGTPRGIFRSCDRGGSWEALTLPQPTGWHDVLSLHRDRAGTLYAGTAGGVVLSSGDGGDSWGIMSGMALPGATGRRGLLARLLEALKITPPPAAPAVPPQPWTLRGPIHAIASYMPANGAPTLFIGTDQGVFSMTGDAGPWHACSAGMPGFDKTNGTADIPVRALALLDDAHLVAATGRGAFSTRIEAAGWKGIDMDPPGSRCSSLAAEAGIVFVGTDDGVKAFAAGGGRFSPQRAWPSPPVSALAIAGDRLYAATAGGIQVLQGAADNPSSWGAGAGWDPLDVQDLTLFEIDSVFRDKLAAGEVTNPLRRRFALFGIELDKDVELRPLYLPISSLGAMIGWELREAPPSARIFRIYAGTPLRVTQLVQNLAGPGDRLAAAGDGVVASVAMGPVLNAEWPDLAIASREVSGDPGAPCAEIYLDRRVDGIETGSRFVLAAAGTSVSSKPELELHEVIAVETILHKAYGKQGIVTRILVTPTEALLAAEPRTTDVHLIDRPLSPFVATEPTLEPVFGEFLTLPGVHGDLAPGRALQVSGPRPGAVIVPTKGMTPEPTLACAGGDCAPALDQQMIAPALKATFAAAGVKLSPGVSVQVLEAGSLWLVRDGDLVWCLDLDPKSKEPQPLAIRATTLYELLSRPLLCGKQPWVLKRGDEVLRVRKGRIECQRAASSQATCTEIVTIAKVVTDARNDRTLVTLTAPPTHLYDVASCCICANVVLVTQGETVTEVLGSGQPDAGRSFTLHRSPLTSTRDRFDYAVRADLEVRVNGESGRALRVGSGFASAPPAAERWSQIASLALAGPAERVFSLTTDETDRSTLHFGDGVHGAKLPSGSNNVAATYRAAGGTGGNVPAGTLIVLRKRPPGIRSATNPAPATGGRNVESLEALRRRAPDKFQCCGRIVTLQDYEDFAQQQPGVGRAQAALIGGKAVRLTLVTSDWLPISQAPALRDKLDAKIRQYRADTLELRIADPLIRPFDVDVAIDLTPGTDFAEVAGRLRRALARKFGPAARGFGEWADPRAVAAAAHVSGVAAAEAIVLYPGNEPAAARDAASDEIGPVKWRFINAGSGISIVPRNG